MSLVRLRPVWMTIHPPSVLWHWLGHQASKTSHLQNDLNCDEWDVKPCSTVTLGAMYLGVQMSNAIGCRVCQLQHRDDAQNVLLQVVVKWSVLMVVCYEKHLGPWSGTLDVSRYEPYQTASPAWYRDITITLWRPLLPYGYCNYKASCARRVKPSFVIFDIRALWRSALSVRVPGCQKLQMTA